MADSDQFDYGFFDANAMDPAARVTARLAIRKWEEAAAVLGPVIGEAEVTALFKRSILLCNRAYPWMEGSGQGFQNSMNLNALERSLAGQPAEVADAGARYLLMTFQDLLASHVGTAFAARLMGQPAQNGPA